LSKHPEHPDVHRRLEPLVASITSPARVRADAACRRRPARRVAAVPDGSSAGRRPAGRSCGVGRRELQAN